MNIKSLLLGSAVASVAFTGAQAADAIFVPEPEPMEYVRVCDVYGAGFFYIPGTETCLKIGGYARYQINWDEDDDGWDKFGRAQLTLDARSETELGTLRSFIELWFQQTSGEANALNVRQAFIELGGLYMGIKTTLWDGALSGEYDNFGYDSKVHTIGYNFAAAQGVNVGIALEEYDNDYDYTPNVVGKLGVSQGWGSADLFAAYDATAEEWAAKIIGKFNLTEPLALELAAAYASGNSVYAPTLGLRDYEWSAGAHLKYAVNNKLSLGFGGQYFADSYAFTTLAIVPPSTTPTLVTVPGGNDDWAIGAVVDYKIVQGFDTKLAINYVDGDSYIDGGFSGFARFTRSF